ncbi:hypothetical protein V6N11_057223 [Hibiscus sabdariffa]|uniref:Uncharacterized protein n=1 Tax=Hibiscus sabdariffa TaxID=183260 RepID=A0ABR2NKM3_9ROSI
MGFVVHPLSKIDPDEIRARAKQVVQEQQLKAPKKKQLQGTQLGAGVPTLPKFSRQHLTFYHWYFLMIDPKSNRLLFAEAVKDFVDFLFYIMSLPVRTVISILEERLDPSETFTTAFKVLAILSCCQHPKRICF